VNLQTYYAFLRKQVKKEETKKIVDKSLQASGQNRTDSVTPSVNAITQYTQEERTAYGKAQRKIRDAKKAEREKAKGKEKSKGDKRKGDKDEDKKQTNPKRQRFNSQTQEADKVDHTNLTGEFIEKGCHHTGLPFLPPGRDLPQGYDLPASMPDQEGKTSFEITETYMQMFPNASRRVVIAIQSNASSLFRAGDTSHEYFCIFHRAHVHKSRSCPAYKMHYPGNGAAPTRNPPDTEKYIEKMQKRKQGDKY
jgi:hypothetical protein